jgi:DNA-binding NarL/FixJ family response regulator
MNKIVLADNQSIFRAGAARVLALEEDMRIVAQMESSSRLFSAIESHNGAVHIIALTLQVDVMDVMARIASVGGRAIFVAENGEPMEPNHRNMADGAVQRDVNGPDLVDTVRRVGRGERVFKLKVAPAEMPAVDMVGSRVRDRLTPREMQIVALIVQGCKNKEIANRLGVTEQVVKNYLRSVYDKTGVSDRLELALFTIHHRTLAEAAAEAGNLLQMQAQAQLQVKTA